VQAATVVAALVITTALVTLNPIFDKCKCHGCPALTNPGRWVGCAFPDRPSFALAERVLREKTQPGELASLPLPRSCCQGLALPGDAPLRFDVLHLRIVDVLKQQGLLQLSLVNADGDVHSAQAVG